MAAKLQTPRLILREYNQSDFEIAYKLLYSQIKAMKFVGKGVLSLAEFQKQFQAIIQHYQEYGFGRFAVVEKASNQLIGDAGLYWSQRCNHPQLGYKLAEAYWHKGYATEAAKTCLEFGFKQLGIKQISAFVIPANHPSQRVLAKVGFEKKEDFIYDGRNYFRYHLSQAKYFA